MPRLSNTDYLHQRNELRAAWFDHRQVFGYLSSNQQFDLHRFFAPTKLLSDAELLERRRKVTTEDPSLPQRAGRAFAAYQTAKEEFQAESSRPRVKISRGHGHIVVRAVNHPEVDTKKLARALVAFMEIERKKRDRQDH